MGHHQQVLSIRPSFSRRTVVASVSPPHRSRSVPPRLSARALRRYGRVYLEQRQAIASIGHDERLV